MHLIISITTIILLTVGSALAQTPYKKWVLNADGRHGQMEVFKDDKITLKRLDNIKQKTFDEDEMTLQIAETVKMGKRTRFVVVEEREERDPKIGIIECFNITENNMHIFALPRHRSIKSVEDAKSYEVPEGLGLKCYAWTKVDEIMKGKNLKEVTKEEVISFLKKFKQELRSFVNNKALDKLERESEVEVYLTGLYFEVWQEMGYNTFIDNIKPGFGIDKFEDNEKIKEHVRDIEYIVESSLSKGGGRTEEAVEMPAEKGE